MEEPIRLLTFLGNNPIIVAYLPVKTTQQSTNDIIYVKEFSQPPPPPNNNRFTWPYQIHTVVTTLWFQIEFEGQIDIDDNDV